MYSFVKGEDPDLSYHTKSNKGCLVSLKLNFINITFFLKRGETLI
jgi:hypothetical protein